MGTVEQEEFAKSLGFENHQAYMLAHYWSDSSWSPPIGPTYSGTEWSPGKPKRFSWWKRLTRPLDRYTLKS